MPGGGADRRRRRSHRRCRCISQHGADGGPYISSSIDYVIDPKTGWTNVGHAPADAARPARRPASTWSRRAICARSTRRAPRAGKPLPVSFVVGAHPIDHVAGDDAAAGRRARPRRRRCATRRCRWSNASPTTSACRPTPNTCSRAISTSAAMSSRKGPTASSSAITARSSATRCSTSPRSRAATTRCSRPRPSAARRSAAPTPRSSRRCAPR